MDLLKVTVAEAPAVRESMRGKADCQQQQATARAPSGPPMG